jgi:hypothetical protein
MPRATCEGLLAIDVREWHRRGSLEYPRRFSVSLSLLEQRFLYGDAYEAMRVDVHCAFNLARLTFRSVEQSVSLTWTPCALGGRRPWFLCPTCSRRVALLYSSGGLFACRHCFGLAYACQQENPTLRAIRRVRKDRMRLGGGFSFAGPFPERPRGMHARTYRRLRAMAG